MGRSPRTALIVSLAAVLIVSGCGRSEPASAVAAARPSVPEPSRPAAPEFYEASGPLVVENQVDVLAQRDGVVARIAVEVGERVRKNQVLAELDNRQLTAERDAAAAKVQAIKFELEHWRAEIKMREADLERDEEMFKNQLITAKQLDHSRYNLQGGKYEIDRETEMLKNAQATLRSLELELDKSRIAAPFDGVVARRYIRAGQRVSSNERTMWVTALAPVSVKFTVPEEFAGKIARGQQVFLSSPANPEQRHPARVTLVSPVVDPSSGTLEVQAQLTETTADLLPGMSVRIRVPRPQ